MLLILPTVPITCVAYSELERDSILLMSKNHNIEDVAGKVQSRKGGVKHD